MRTQSHLKSYSKPEAAEITSTREILARLATAETARTVSHAVIVGNAMLSSYFSPLISSSLNSVFSTIATAATYGRTPEKIRNARLEDLQMLITKIRPLFTTSEMQALFADSASYQESRKQFEKLDRKYSCLLETKSKPFRYLIFAIGFIGTLYFILRLLQENHEAIWTEAMPMIFMMFLMSYSNYQSHQDLLMCSRKDYQELIEALIVFQTKMLEEVPILKMVMTLEQMKKEMEECEERLRELSVEVPKIRKIEVGGVRESKGEEKSLLECVESRLQNLVAERDEGAEKIQKQKEIDLRNAIFNERRIIVEQRTKLELQNIQRRYTNIFTEIQTSLKKLWYTQKSYREACKKLHQFFEKLMPTQLAEIDDDGITNVLAKRLPDMSHSPEDIVESSSPIAIESGVRI